MSNIERIGVSVESDLLNNFDRLIDKKGYPNRSEALRDLIRMSLSENELNDPFAEAVGGIFMVYDHHTTGLSYKLNQMQHSHFYHIITSTHIHLDHHNCLEIIVLKGKVAEIQKLADQLGAVKGVKISKVNMIALAGG